MEHQSADMIRVYHIKILAPEDRKHSVGGPQCLCCGECRSMDEDACGICDECIAP